MKLGWICSAMSCLDERGMVLHIETEVLVMMVLA